MSSPEEEEEEGVQQEVRDLLLTEQECANSVDLPDGDRETKGHYTAEETMFLSGTKLEHIPESILKSTPLKHLYLEGNHISSLPDSMFSSLPSLQWLDLRNNLITSLPAEIGLHRCLRTLLLEGNPISALPPELGNVISLRGLNLRNCPLTFPPQDIMHQGLQCILHFLRSAMAERPVSIRKSNPDLPQLEKLQLSEMLRSSVEEQEESVDEDDLERFRELREKMILLDRAELGRTHPRQTEQSDGNLASHLPPTVRIKEEITKGSITPEFPPFHIKHGKRSEGKSLPMINERRAALEHRIKSQLALQEWQTQAKITQKRKISEYKQKRDGGQRRGESIMTFDLCGFPSETSLRELEQQIHALVEKMQERHRNPRGTAAEQITAAEQDIEEMRKLRTLVSEEKRKRY
ncbi:uncharacterized protein LOC143015331 [Genypterus blacodes]|uniref:uncharacterized protein LOC143015331 n=1 Tax=Genypterus blacodes TaxID=154954 RepID=UPI003F76B7C8